MHENKQVLFLAIRATQFEGCIGAIPSDTLRLRCVDYQMTEGYVMHGDLTLILP